jgi:nucleotide-binding universal stress UspA family protein
VVKKLLIPLDGSALAERALAYATALSIPTSARLAAPAFVDSRRGVQQVERTLDGLRLSSSQTFTAWESD